MMISQPSDDLITDLELFFVCESFMIYANVRWIFTEVVKYWIYANIGKISDFI